MCIHSMACSRIEIEWAKGRNTHLVAYAYLYQQFEPFRLADGAACPRDSAEASE